MKKAKMIDPSNVEYTLEYLKNLFHKGNLIDARKGGLVLGKQHPPKGQKHLNCIHILTMGGNITNFLLDLKMIENENFASYWGSIEGGENSSCRLRQF